MSWFKISDLNNDIPVEQPEEAFSTAVTGPVVFADGEDLRTVKKTIGDIKPNSSVFFMTNGAWSNISILEYLLQITGPADVYFSTWSISADAIRKFTLWKESGLITDLYAVMDIGIRNRKPEIYQQAIAAFPKLKLSKCHAKVAVILGDKHAFTVMGSANFTRNPRREAGMITSDIRIAEANASWIVKEVCNVR